MNYQEKIKIIEKFILDNSFFYSHLDGINEQNIDTIYSIITGNVNDIESDDKDINRFMGLRYYDDTTKTEYYLKKSMDLGDAMAPFTLARKYRDNKNYKEMTKYYLMAIEKGNVMAMKRLAEYYKKIKKYDIMEKYFAMASEHGDIDSTDILGVYHQTITKNYEKMMGYYLKAIEKNHDASMFNLGVYYHKLGDYDNMKKYYLMAIEYGNKSAMHNLAIYYENIKDYDNAKKYFEMAIKFGNERAMHNYAVYYGIIENNDEKWLYYLKMAAERNCVSSVYTLGSYYRNISDSKKMTEYFLKLTNLPHDTLNDNEIIDVYLSLASYYKLVENDNDKMIKYYLQATELAGPKMIIELVNTNNKYDIQEILAIGAEKGIKQCIDIINEILNERFTITFAYQFYKYLDDGNLKKFNEYLRVHHILKTLDLTEMTKTENCIICNEDFAMTEFKCKHSICCKCYDRFILMNIKNCPLCRKEI